MFGTTFVINLSFFFFLTFNSNNSHKYVWLEIFLNLNKKFVIIQNFDLIKSLNF